MSYPQVRLLAATEALLTALKSDRARFGELVGSPVPDGWPEFPEAIDFTLAHLRTAPEADRLWSMQFFIDQATGRLLGSGGFAAPPAERTVEIGYEIAPEFRGRGSARPLREPWSSTPLPAARSITSARTPCPDRTHRRVCSCRSASHTSTTARTPRSAASGSGAGPDRWTGNRRTGRLWVSRAECAATEPGQSR
jgi:Acetyltransferases, including N-acetylases of ribosomal proteins